MTALPHQIPARLQQLNQSPHIASAYNICLNLEASLQADEDNGRNVSRQMIYCRILGYLIHYVPSDHGLENLLEEISSCNGDHPRLLSLGEMYFDCYIREFRASKGRTPTASNHSSRPSFNLIQDMVGDMLVATPQTHAQAEANALIRDGFRCVVTGTYNFDLVRSNRELQELVRSEGSRSGSTECAYIFAEPTNTDTARGSDDRDGTASMWAVIAHFGHAELRDELNGSKIHRLENVITFDSHFHYFFNHLYIWFVATDEINKYKLEGVRGISLCHYPEYVTFTTRDPAKLPVPSPTYLAIHATCAKVANLSGAADYIDKLDQDMEDIMTLDPDSASAETLEHALSQVLVS
ncbi:hypothetical protein BD410DRAFT_789150 [Rickenella mellea]|uniref:HNH nuclease domain-containing protein n=1 Tax=Rickenella mellea TaxID=50990 RepID=A0A4Y7Q437_9AGAM|nr:hypothetical protein BD410DRAFT_789150 [Rickenella mellea]